MREKPTTKLPPAAKQSEVRVRLRYSEGEAVVGRDRRSWTCGRTDDNDLAVADDAVSRRHAQVRYKNGRVSLTDDSTNGTVLDRDGWGRLSIHEESVPLDGRGRFSLGYADGPTIEFVVELWSSDREAWVADVPRDAGADDGVEEPYLFRREGEYWTVVFDGQVLRLRNLRGLQYLGHLIRYPGQEFHALDLVASVASTAPDVAAHPGLHDGDNSMHVDDAAGAGPLLDPQAKSAYRQRLSELRGELEEAERNNDVGRASQIHTEIEAIAGQLASAVGLGGRDREAASNAERARVTVTVRVREVMKRLRQHHPALGDHLERSVRTGRFCIYDPDPARPIPWVF